MRLFLGVALLVHGHSLSSRHASLKPVGSLRRMISRPNRCAGVSSTVQSPRSSILVGPDNQPLRTNENTDGDSSSPSLRRAPSDVFGKSFIDYHNHKFAEDMDYEVVTLDYHDTEKMPISYFFRSMDEMPHVELEALRICRGRVLDVGCGAGSHALILQNKMDLDVTGLDLSQGAIQVAKKRGLRKAISGSFFDFRPKRDGTVPEGAFWDESTHAEYDTILFMMNGIGVAGTGEGLDRVLQRARSLLAPGGQVLLDSTDLQYMYVSEDGKNFEFDFDPKEHYYGETLITVRYNGEQETFPWLFIDYEALTVAAHRNGFQAIFVADETLVEEGRGPVYLARLVPTEVNPLAEDIKNAPIMDPNDVFGDEKGKKSPILGID